MANDNLTSKTSCEHTPLYSHDSVGREYQAPCPWCLQQRVVDLEAEKTEHQQSFDLRWKADMRAIKRWQEAHPGNDLTWPDHADMVVWMLEQMDAGSSQPPADSDLLDRLRNPYRKGQEELRNEAADEIERLTRELTASAIYAREVEAEYKARTGHGFGDPAPPSASLVTIARELDASFDLQTMKENVRLEYDAPDDHEYCVNITAKQLRALDRAVLETHRPAVTKSEKPPMGTMYTVRAHKHTCANVQPGSTHEDECDCGAVVNGEPVRIPDETYATRELKDATHLPLCAVNDVQFSGPCDCRGAVSEGNRP